jgi:hypothetical protein
MKINCKNCKHIKKNVFCEAPANLKTPSGRKRNSKRLKKDTLNKDETCPLFVRKLYDT